MELMQFEFAKYLQGTYFVFGLVLGIVVDTNLIWILSD